MVDMDEIASIIRAEVACYTMYEFSDTDDFVRDVHILPDDLSEIALTLEGRFGVVLDRSEYRKVHNVLSYATAIHQRLSGRHQ